MENIFPAPRSDCSGAQYCNKWRICERCARIRAARFADRAQFLAARYGKLAMARITPEINSESEMKKLRDRIVREKLAPAGLWTIETGELFAKLHLNLLLPHERASLYKASFEYFEVVRTNVRSVAAYMVKRKGMPVAEQYSGRLMGEWGSIATCLLASHDPQHAPAQAALLQQTIWNKWTHHGVTHFTRATVAEPCNQPEPRREKSMLEYAEVARRHLPDLMKLCQR